MSTSISEKKYRGLLAVFLLTVALCFTIVIGAILVVDPFFHYHAPLATFPYVVDNQLTQNPGMARHLSYDSAIVGSSMTVNFDTGDFEELLGLHTVKLSYDGSYPRNHAVILEQIFQTHTVDAIFLAIDPPTFTADVNETKYEMPWYLYDDNPWNDLPYLLSKDVFLQYVLRPVVNRNPTDWRRVYAEDWRIEEWAGRDWVLQNYEPAPLEKELTPAGALDEQALRNVRTNLAPFIEAHPETTFYFFIPPYSILFWNDQIRMQRLDATLSETVCIAEALLQYDNARVFFFQDMEDMIADLDNYEDYSHYRPAWNRFMVERFADGGFEVHAGEIEKEAEKLRAFVTGFDFDALLNE